MKKVNPMNITSKMTVGDLISEFKKSGVFNAGSVAKAVDIYQEMIEEKATIFLGLSGALVPAGLKKIVSDLIRDGMIDVLVTTGANLTHDMIEAFGGSHYIGNLYENDLNLKENDINRIYDVFLPEKHYKEFGIHIREIYSQLGKKELSIREFLYEIGGKIEDPTSIMKTAHDMDLPIFCPAISDSEIGLSMWEYSNKLKIDAFRDLEDFVKIVRNSEKIGVIILGGGVPKNFIFQSMVPEVMKAEKGGHDYVIQITLDRPETGGLSGATLEEALSWGKVKGDGKKVCVVSEVTVVFPLIIAALRERLER